MSYRESAIYFDTVWSSLTEGLRERLLTAAKQAMERKGGGSHDVSIGSLTEEHRAEIEWLMSTEGDRTRTPFVMSQSGPKGNVNPPIKLSSEMAEYITHEFLQKPDQKR